MLRVALTGGIATGKSYVAGRLRDLGVPVIDADVLARAAVAPGTEGFAAVVRRFGTAVLAPDGALDRARLGDIVFRDPTARRDLEAIVHPPVRRAIEAFFQAQPPGTPFAVADIPLLFESGRTRDFDRVVVAACDHEMQMRRLMTRDGLSREDAARRVAAQWPIEEKMARADHVVRTDGPHADTDAQVAALAARLTSDAAAR
jgi:dephospho-CoA kinase